MQAPESITTTTHHHHPGTHTDSGGDTARHHTHTHTVPGQTNCTSTPGFTAGEPTNTRPSPLGDAPPCCPISQFRFMRPGLGDSPRFLRQACVPSFYSALHRIVSRRLARARAALHCFLLALLQKVHTVPGRTSRLRWAAQVSSGRSISAPQHCSSAAASLAHSTHATILRTQPGTRRRRQISFCE